MSGADLKSMHIVLFVCATLKNIHIYHMCRDSNGKYILNNVMSSTYQINFFNIAPLQKPLLRASHSTNAKDQGTQNFHFHLLLRKYMPCSFSPNNSRWHNRRVRSILHLELYASQLLKIPLFPFYFVSHLDHLLISFKRGGIC